jgi:hypothetical protein
MSITMPKNTANVKFIHPFITYDREFECGDDMTLNELIEKVMQDTKAHGRYTSRAGRHIDRLQGCVVMHAGDQIGYFDDSGFVLIDNEYETVHNSDEFIITIATPRG